MLRLMLAIAFLASNAAPALSPPVTESTHDQAGGRQVLDLPTPKDANERKALDDIKAFGHHVVYVLEEGELPPFAYSVGIAKTTGRAEVIVVGFKPELSHTMVNEYARRISAGGTFEPGKRYSGFIEGFAAEVRGVHPDQYEEYFGWDLWLYRGRNFKAIQLILPDTQGNWPWDEGASSWFRARQPILDVSSSAVQPDT